MRLPPKIPNSKLWKDVIINEYKFNYITKFDQIPSDGIWTTSCSKTKNSLKKGIPKNFYQGRYNNLFYKFAEKYDLKYGVISDKYGIHMYNEKLEFYDIHPNELTYKNKRELGIKIRKKIKKYGFKKLIFYYPSPLLSHPYFEMLWYSKIPIYYISRIGLIDIKE